MLVPSFSRPRRLKRKACRWPVLSLDVSSSHPKRTIIKVLVITEDTSQRRPSGFKSGGRGPGQKKFDFIGKLLKNFDFFQAISQKIDFSEQISEKFPFLGNFTKNFDFLETFLKFFDILGNFTNKRINFQGKFLKNVDLFQIISKKILIFQGFSKNFDCYA